MHGVPCNFSTTLPNMAAGGKAYASRSSRGKLSASTAEARGSGTSETNRGNLLNFVANIYLRSVPPAAYNCILGAKRGYYGFIIVVVRRDFLLATYSPHFFPDFFHFFFFYLPPARREIIKRIPCVCSCVIECVSRIYKGLYITLVVSPWPFQCFL